MALLKKKGENDAPGEDAPVAKPRGKLLGLLAPVLVFGAAFGASWFAAPDATTAAPEAAKETHEIAPSDLAQGWKPAKPDLTLDLEPLTITAGGQGQVLKIGLSLELWDRHAEIETARLRDAFTAYLRAVDAAQLADPSFHMRLKRALLHRARIISGEDVVADVLITDFLLTS